MTKKTFIVAVSGGVDSCVLLHKLMANKPEYVTYIVAHVDHRIRDNSSRDAEFVEKMALKYNLLFRKTVLKNAKTDEDSLRQKRYDFLYELKDEYKAEAIITAHHQDDLLESMVINILRGTGPRGLRPMKREGLLRPLLNSAKKQLLEYAQDNNLKWVEDESNSDETYLRNYVRANIMNKLEPKRHEFIECNKQVDALYEDIDMRVSHMTPKRNILNRSSLILLPHSVAKEVVRSWLLQNGVADITARMIESATIAAKTLLPNKKIDIGNAFWLSSKKEVLVLVNKTDF